MTEVDGARLRQGAEYAGRWIAYQQAVRDIPGVVVGIRWGNETVLLEAHGKADIERDVPMSTEHIFRIASHSKTFTAVAVMQLVEAGTVRLDDPLQIYIPWLRGTVAQASIRQALNHAAGVIRDGLDSDYWQLDRPFPGAGELRAMVEDGGGVLEPNERFKYSNIAYSLLGMVIETASGMSYSDYTRTYIVDRLGLRATGPETDDLARAGLVTGYTPRVPDMPRQPIPDVETHAMAAATGFYSTASDLLRYASAHFMGNEELLTDASKREMQAPYWDTGNGTHYGLGMAVTTVGERRLVGHSGSFPGHSSRTWIDPENELAVVVLMNQSGGPTRLFADTTVKLLHCALSAGTPSSEEAAELDRLTGRFWTTWGANDIVRFGDRLYLLDPSADDPTDCPATLEPMGEETLRIEIADGYDSPGETVRYERDGDDRITRVRIGGGSAYPEEIFREKRFNAAGS
jgi:D-alanyl-D-alanine carboxypeptidase